MNKKDFWDLFEKNPVIAMEKVLEENAELENQLISNFDFDSIRHKIKNEIDQLTAKIKALDLLESEFA